MKIKWSLNELKKYDQEPLHISDQINLEKALQKRDKQVLAATPIDVDGWLFLENSSEVMVDLQLQTTLTLPSSRSLNPVDVKLSIPFSEVYIAPGYSLDAEKYQEDEIVVELESEMLDLQKPLEDSVLAAIPTQVFTQKELDDKEMPKGNDWEVVSEDEYYSDENSDEIKENSPFAELEDLFSDEEKND